VTATAFTTAASRTAASTVSRDDKKAGRTIALSWHASSPRKPAFRTLGEHFRLTA
jgi:hypothetical protein